MKIFLSSPKVAAFYVMINSIFCLKIVKRVKYFCTLSAVRSADNIFLRETEKGLWKEGFEFVIGVDEAGRGPIAGPVVAAAVVAPVANIILETADSKKLSEKKRKAIHKQIMMDKSFLVTFSVVNHTVVDERNILQATLTAMNETVFNLLEKYSIQNLGKVYVLVDGDKTPNKMPVPSRPIIRGDALVYPIALASIVAKVERDRIMCAYDLEYPMYGFAKHKGYPTKEHIRALHQYGPCPIHRLSFKPVQNRKPILVLPLPSPTP